MTTMPRRYIRANVSPTKSKCSSCGNVGHNKRNKQCPLYVTTLPRSLEKRKEKAKQSVIDPIVEYLHEYFGDKIPETPDELHAKLRHMDDNAWNKMIASCGPEYQRFKRR